jgi:hypothetical protein
VRNRLARGFMDAYEWGELSLLSCYGVNVDVHAYVSDPPRRMAVSGPLRG